MNSGSSLIQQQNIRDVEVGKSQFSFQYPKVWTSGEQGRMTTSRNKPRAEASRQARTAQSLEQQPKRSGRWNTYAGQAPQDVFMCTAFPPGGQRDGRWEYVITNTKPAEMWQSFTFPRLPPSRKNAPDASRSQCERCGDVAKLFRNPGERGLSDVTSF
ncbi:hypothetical protein CTAM01_12911 [Colletotrichum tamarilloi]|uniref:Uncharacterized protein n=1 Tax=Colletotrichum tamarilloi TaxID=1209934 RepID=A0ABQ9QTP5_9PEZI|nr:uncharacterized protein CTAM01_12911 [Colletotrichum tamarilloi]KAK1484667.1 hypothetical protein CTAM01_12911 [Colletotrichum tamarilloi]